MVPVPTTGHGIYYPDSSGSTNLWEHHQTQAESVETALDTYETFTTWNPSFTIFTGVGVGGVKEGFYQRIGNLVHAEFRFEFGTSGITIGSGTVQLTLPVAAYIGWGGSITQGAFGSWHARDDSAAGYHSGTIHGDSASGLTCTFSGAWSGAVPNNRISEVRPFTWAVSDIFTGVLNYRCA